MALEIEVLNKEKGVHVVNLLGSLDTATYRDLEEEFKVIFSKRASALVLNLEGLVYISSMGVSTILKAKKSIEGQGGSFMMTNLQPQIKRVFEIINALPSMRVFESLQEADAYLGAIQKRVMEQGQGT